MNSPANIQPESDASIANAADILRAGGLVAFPTETVYGLGADARDDAAVTTIFAAKDRPSFNPLIVHISDLPAAAGKVQINDMARALAETFWPGPLSIVLPLVPDGGLSLLVSAGLDTVALRAPAHPLARALLSAFGGPIAAPSANAAGTISPTTAAHVANSLGDRPDLILDGGACSVGLESTVLDLSRDRPAVLRHGSVTLEQLRATVGAVEDASTPEPGKAPRSPGQIARHYAPSIPVRLSATSADADEAVIDFGPDEVAGGAIRRNLSPDGDLAEAAANLFATLHSLDDPRYAGIAVAPIPENGLGRAINDRLTRALAAHTN